MGDDQAMQGGASPATAADPSEQTGDHRRPRRQSSTRAVNRDGNPLASHRSWPLASFRGSRPIGPRPCRFPTGARHPIFRWGDERANRADARPRRARGCNRTCHGERRVGPRDGWLGAPRRAARRDRGTDRAGHGAVCREGSRDRGRAGRRGADPAPRHAGRLGRQHARDHHGNPRVTDAGGRLRGAARRTRRQRRDLHPLRHACRGDGAGHQSRRGDAGADRRPAGLPPPDDGARRRQRRGTTGRRIEAGGGQPPPSRTRCRPR